MKPASLNRRALLKCAIAAIAAVGGFGAANVAHADYRHTGVVYTQTNAAAGNEIVVMRRALDGSLTTAGRVATGGLGTGGGLGNQGALALTRNGRWLFAVNAGSNDISVFAAHGTHLQLVDKTPSGGERPVSLTVNDRALYVLNAGDTNNITGFTVGQWGKLTPIANSTKPLSAAATGPAQVEFDRSGDLLVVTEKATNKISLYTVEDDAAMGPVVRDSVGLTPFGFAFDRRNNLIVSEAFGGAPNASALSSYDVDSDDARLRTISASVGTQQTAACWVVVTRDGRYAYTTNTASGSISGYRVGRDGSLKLLNSDGRTAVTGAGSGPTDAALSRASRFLYVLSAANGTVAGFRVGADGSLKEVNSVGGLAAGATGLVAR